MPSDPCDAPEEWRWFAQAISKTQSLEKAEQFGLRRVLTAARRLQPGHAQDEGVMVSAEHLRLLLAALEEYDKMMTRAADAE